MKKPVSSEVLMFANVLLRAVEIRNGSYDAKAAAEATEDSNRSYYTMSVAAACERAATYLKVPAFGVPVELLLRTNCVDAITWANAVTDPTAVCEPTRYTCQHDAEYNCPLCLANYARVGGAK